MKRVVHAACPHDCPDACGVLITIEDGRATKLQGDPKHPVTRGFLCAKVAKYLDRVYSPGRLLYPMRRRAGVPKGKGHRGPADFEPITWDQALDEICERFRGITQQFGPEAILPYSYGGTLGALNGASMDRRFFHRLGASQLDRTICSIAGEVGLRSVLGVKMGTEPEQFRYSKYIIAWGANIHGNNVHLWPFIEEARRAGARLVVIDPYRTRTAACADWYLPINPGTDAALALGMMHIIIRDQLYDAGYVERFTLGFDQLRQRVAQYPPDRVAQWTGITAADIETLAREYATTHPAAIRVNYGLQRTEHGGMAMRSVAMLPCLTGSWKEVGGGLQLSLSESFNINRKALELPELMESSPLGRRARLINMVELGKALTELATPPVQALLVYNSNPAAVAPNHHLVIRGLCRPDLFTVVHEQFFTDTTDYADILLPATTFFEHKDLVPSYGHYYLQASHQAIAPLGECRSNVEMFRSLAQRMGFAEPCFRESDDELIATALHSPHPHLAGITQEQLEHDGHVRLNFPAERRSPDKVHFLPFAHGNFLTPSGKAEFYSQTLADQGIDPVVAFVPATESRHAAKTSAYPLEMLARKCDNFLNSTFSNIPSVRALENPGLLEIHRSDAEARGIRSGDTVRVFNQRGELRLQAHVNGAVQPGVVVTRLNWAKLHAEGHNINALVSDRLSDMGGGATFYAALVDVERVAGKS